MVKHVRMRQIICNDQRNRAGETLKETDDPEQNIFALAAKRASFQKVRSAVLRRLRFFSRGPLDTVSTQRRAFRGRVWRTALTPDTFLGYVWNQLNQEIPQTPPPPADCVPVGDVEEAKEVFFGNAFKEAYGEPYKKPQTAERVVVGDTEKAKKLFKPNCLVTSGAPYESGKQIPTDETE